VMIRLQALAEKARVELGDALLKRNGSENRAAARISGAN